MMSACPWSTSDRSMMRVQPSSNVARFSTPVSASRSARAFCTSSRSCRSVVSPNATTAYTGRFSPSNTSE